jgi:hypothetical protein
MSVGCDPAVAAAHVRFTPKADNAETLRYVRFVWRDYPSQLLFLSRQLRPLAFDHGPHFIRDVVDVLDIEACTCGGALGLPASSPCRRQCEVDRCSAF